MRSLYTPSAFSWTLGALRSKVQMASVATPGYRLRVNADAALVTM